MRLVTDMHHFFMEKMKILFVTPYNEPMLEMLQKFHGVLVEKTVGQLDFHEKISASVHNHHIKERT